MITIDDRMKDYYEKRGRRYLTRRTPVVIRIDGKAFHTYTKGLDKPFDSLLVADMQATALQLCKQIQGCKFGYVQSDEISLLLTDYDTLQTDAWFDYCQNKMESIAASIATAEFNFLRVSVFNTNLALFDARSFNIPREEVCNYFVWRQQDATKNSISMLAQSLYSHKELQGKNGNEMQEMCFQKGKNWNNLPIAFKRGTAIYKQRVKKDLTEKVSREKLETSDNTWVSDGKWGVYTNEWYIDQETPIFSQNRELIENLV